MRARIRAGATDPSHYSHYVVCERGQGGEGLRVSSRNGCEQKNLERMLQGTSKCEGLEFQVLKRRIVPFQLGQNGFRFLRGFGRANSLKGLFYRSLIGKPTG